MAKYLVRHAKAGQRRDWNALDEFRPLSNAGWRQAHAIAERLAQVTTGPLISSPFTRCRQTLEPLATQLGCVVINDIRLGEAQSFEPALELLTTSTDGTALCTHGDLLPELITALVRRGALLATMPDWRKGVVWELTQTHDPSGERSTPIGLMRAWGPPEI